MNDKEFARLLLCEAAELLNEGGGSRRTKADRQEKEREFYIEKQKKMPSYETFKKITNYDAKGSERESHAQQMYDREKSFGKYADFNKLRVYKNHIKNAGKMADSDYNKNVRKLAGYDQDRAQDISKRAGRSLDRFYNSIMGYAGAIKSEYDKMPKNESIAVLLTEAALLLNESTDNSILQKAKQIAKRINDEVIKYKKSSKVGNQNCMLCTLCAEANFRNIDILPRPVYSPRDIIFKDDLLKKLTTDVNKILIKNINDIKNNLINAGDGSRFYIHVNWKNSKSGHEFILLNILNDFYVMDPQAGIVKKFDNAKKYFDINYNNSFIVRLDNIKINDKKLKMYNSNKCIIEWDDKIDIEYLKKME